MKETAYIGIDPGKTGFITLCIDNKFSFFPMPYHRVSTGEKTEEGKPVTKSEFYERGLLKLAITLRDLTSRCDRIKIAIEEVGGRGGWSATNNFNFGHTAGLQKFLCLLVSDEDPLMIRPQKWQSYIRQGYAEIKKPSSTGKTMISDPKAVAKMIVEKEFPDIDFRKTNRAKKVDDNKIDSFLICQYLIRTDTKL